MDNVKKSSLRDYGMPNPEPLGVPQWSRCEDAKAICPNCGACLCEVRVPVKLDNVSGGEGLCTYLGCPACPYASPSMTRSAKITQDGEYGSGKTI